MLQVFATSDGCRSNAAAHEMARTLTAMGEESAWPQLISLHSLMPQELLAFLLMWVDRRRGNRPLSLHQITATEIKLHVPRAFRLMTPQLKAHPRQRRDRSYQQIQQGTARGPKQQQPSNQQKDTSKDRSIGNTNATASGNTNFEDREHLKPILEEFSSRNQHESTT